MLPNGLWIGLGGNQEGSEAALRAAVDALARIAPLRGVSSLFVTAPCEYLDQPDFLNLVVHADLPISLEPDAVLDILLATEQQLGRQRVGAIRKGPRLLDLDLLLFGSLVIDTPRLVLPHPAMHQRRFVLEPLLELCPLLDDPKSGRPYRDWHSGCSDQAIYSRRHGWYTA